MFESILAFLIGVIGSTIAATVGLGGAMFFRPMYRIILGTTGTVALGTPVALTFITAVLGTLAYHKADLANKKVAIIVGLVGGFASIFSAQITTLFSGKTLMLINAAVIFILGWFVYLRPHKQVSRRRISHQIILAVGSGLFIGLGSGFLGLGGGVFMVPIFVLMFGMPTKQAAATSLFAMVLISLPNTIAHYTIGNIDLMLVLWSGLGIVLGTIVGTKYALRISRSRHKYLVLCAYMLASVSLGAYEILT